MTVLAGLLAALSVLPSAAPDGFDVRFVDRSEFDPARVPEGAKTGVGPLRRTVAGDVPGLFGGDTPAPFLDRLEIAATLKERNGGQADPVLIGDRVSMKIIRPSPRNGLLDLGRGAYGLDRLRRPDGTAAAAGRTSDGRLLVHCNDPEIEVVADFLSAGRRVADEMQFLLQLPPALSASLTLTVPAGLRIECDAGVVSGPTRKGGPRKPGVWQVRLSRVPAALIRVVPDVSVYEPPALLLTPNFTYRVNERELTWQADLLVERFGTAPKSVTLELTDLGLPPGSDYGLEAVLLDGDRLGGRRTVRSGRRRTLEVALAGAARSRIELQGRVPRNGEKLSLPGVRVTGARVIGGEAVLAAEPPLRVERLALKGYLQEEASLDSGGDRMKFRRTDTNASIEAWLGPPPAVLTADVLVRIDDRGSVREVRSYSRVSLEQGSVFEVPFHIPAAARVVDVREVAGGRVASWNERSGDDGSRVLDVSFGTPLTPTAVKTVEVVTVEESPAPGSAEPVPAVVTADAKVESAFLITLGSESQRGRPLNSLGVIERGPEELAENSPLANLAQLPAGPYAIYEASDLNGVRVGVPRGGSGGFAAGTPAAAESGRDAATLAVELRLPRDPTSPTLVVATFDVRQTSEPPEWSVRLPEPAEWVGASVDGNAVSAVADDGRPSGATVWRLKRPTGGRSLEVTYRMPASSDWITRDVDVALPSGPVPVEGYVVTATMPPNERPSGVAGNDSTHSQETWRSRIFGPLARPAGTPLYWPSWLEAEENGSRTSGRVSTHRGRHAGQPVLVDAGFKPPERLRLTTYRVEQARAAGTVALVVCFAVGCWLRQAQFRVRRRATFWWWCVCAALAWIAPPTWAVPFGGAAAGTLLSALVPRRLFGWSPDFDPLSVLGGSTVTAALLVLLAPSVTGAAIQEEAAPAASPATAVGDGPDTETTVLYIPTDDGQAVRIRPTTEVYVRDATPWPKASALLRNSRYRVFEESESADVVDVDAELEYFVPPGVSGVRVDVGRAVSLSSDTARRDGEPLTLVPLQGGVFAPLDPKGGIQRVTFRSSLDTRTASRSERGLPDVAPSRWLLPNGMQLAGQGIVLTPIEGGGDAYVVPSGVRASLTRRRRIRPPLEPVRLGTTVSTTSLAANVVWLLRFPEGVDGTRPVDLTLPAGAVVRAVDAGRGGGYRPVIRRVGGGKSGTNVSLVLPERGATVRVSAVVPFSNADAIVLPAVGVKVGGEDADVLLAEDSSTSATQTGRLTLTPPQEERTPTAVIEHVGDFGPDALAWTTRTRFGLDLPGDLFHEFSVLPTLQVRDVTVEADGREIPCRWTRRGRRLSVLLDGRDVRDRRVTVSGMVPLRASDGQSLPQVTPRLPTANVSSELVLSNSSRNRVKLISDRLAGIVSDAPTRFPGWPRLGPEAFTVEPVRGEVQVEQAYVLPESGPATVYARLPDTAALRRVSVIAPGSATGGVLLQENGANTSQGGVETPGGRSANRPTIVSAAFDRNLTSRLPWFQVTGSAVRTLYAAVPVGVPLSPPDADRLAKSEVPDWLRDQLPSDLEWNVYRIAEDSTGLREDLTDLPAAVADARETVVLSHAGGRLFGVTGVSVRDAGRLPPQIPEGATLLAAWSDGSPANVAADRTVSAERTARFWWSLPGEGSGKTLRLPGMSGTGPPAADSIAVAVPGWALAMESDGAAPSNGSPPSTATDASPGYGGVLTPLRLPQTQLRFVPSGTVPTLRALSTRRQKILGAVAGGLIAVLLFLFATANPRSTAIAEGIALRPWTAGLILGLIWWLFLTPGFLGFVVTVGSVVVGAVRQVRAPPTLRV